MDTNTQPKKPTPEQYGYCSDNTPEGESGWMLEGGEEAFDEAMKRYNFMIENDLCEEDMVNDIKYPTEI